MSQRTALTLSRHSNNDLARASGRSFLFGSPTIEQSFGENEIIFDEGEGIDFIYKVTRGMVRVYKTFSDGRRKIEAFCMPDDVFGIDLGGRRQSCAQAICRASVMLAHGNLIMAPQPCGVARELFSVVDDEVRRIQRHVLLLAMTSTQRVTHFLLEMLRRQQTDIIKLPMTRQDIGDYLGLTIETVSRCMTKLKIHGLIETRHMSEIVVLRDVAALLRVCDGDREYESSAKEVRPIRANARDGS